MRVLIIVFFLLLSLRAEPPIDDKKILYTNLIGSATIVTWGVLNWDYGERSMHAFSEGWFGKDTKHGGVDKLGHFYMTYIFSHYFASLYSDFGYEKKKAIRQGAYSSLILNTIMEVGDSFSEYGFSYEDFIINTLGAYIGYYLLMNPDVNDIIDIRSEYLPTSEITSGDSYDVFTDYDGMKFIAAVKFDGFERLQDTFMKYFEFHVGYYTRKKGGAIDRNPYVAIGVNLSHLLKPVSKRASGFFNYYQMPYSYISSE